MHTLLRTREGVMQNLSTRKPRIKHECTLANANPSPHSTRKNPHSRAKQALELGTSKVATHENATLNAMRSPNFTNNNYGKLVPKFNLTRETFRPSKMPQVSLGLQPSSA